MNYADTIAYLYSRLPMFSRIGEAAIKKDLTNTRVLCSYLGDPQRQFPAVHIAGTNGKGSTSHMLAAVLQTAGYRTGLYTSPHLYDFRERIRINGSMVPEDYVAAFVSQHQQQIEAIAPSFFEVTVAMALDYFAAQKVDIAVIETGLGGRLDSTNIITPVLSLITNIGYDHMNILGDTLDDIAFEKAGIIKKRIPVVIGEKQQVTDHVFRKKAAAEEAPLHFAEEFYRPLNSEQKEGQLELTVENLVTHSSENFILDLPGIYQQKNLLAVLKCTDLLNSAGWNISHTHRRDALAQVKLLTGLKGRWEQLHSSPAVIIDVAHNRDGLLAVLQQLDRTPCRRLHWILGMVKDKDIGNILNLLPKEAVYYFTRAQLPRALDEKELCSRAAALGLQGLDFPDVNTAMQKALADADTEDLVLVCGSVFIAGELNLDLFSK